MPAGDPAGYLPNVVKSRLKKKGVKPYKPRSKQPEDSFSGLGSGRGFRRGKPFAGRRKSKPGDKKIRFDV